MNFCEVVLNPHPAVKELRHRSSVPTPALLKHSDWWISIWIPSPLVDMTACMHVMAALEPVIYPSKGLENAEKHFSLHAKGLATDRYGLQFCTGLPEPCVIYPGLAWKRGVNQVWRPRWRPGGDLDKYQLCFQPERRCESDDYHFLTDFLHLY